MTEEQRARARELLRPIEFGSLCAVLNGTKPALRIVGRFGSAAALQQLADDLDVSFAVGTNVVEIADASGHIAHKQWIISRPPRDENDRVGLYLGADEFATQLARMFDARDDHRLGHILGYPECCIQFYEGHGSDDHYDLIDRVAAPSGGRYDFRINHAYRHFGLGLIGHFPCRWDCEASVEVAEQTLAALREHDPALADETIAKLRSDMLYSPELVLAARDTCWDADLLRLEPGAYEVTGECQPDAVRLDGRVAVLMRKGVSICRIANPVWLPFASQAFPRG